MHSAQDRQLWSGIVSYGPFAVERYEKETGRANDSFHDFDDVFAPVGSGRARLDIPVLAVPGQV